MGSKEKNMDLTSTENILDSEKKFQKRISGQISLRWKSETCIFPMEKIKS